MKLTLSQFFESINNPVYLKYKQDLIVEVNYKYKWEKCYTVENEILEYDGDHDDWIWTHDWDEGQSSDPLGVYISGYVPVSDIDVYREMINYKYKNALRKED